MDQPPTDPPRPPVRTFHARTGRLSGDKRRVLAELLPRFELRSAERPVAVDFGCGAGEVLLELAARQPDRLWVGVDVHRASMATLARAIADAGLGNVRLHLGDGVEFLHRRIDVESLQLLQVLFPDPWPKNAHRARRLVQPAFAALVAGRLAPGGGIELATDSSDYARQMVAVLGARLRGGPCSRPDRPVTFYERTARDARRPVVHLRFAAPPAPPPTAGEQPGKTRGRPGEGPGKAARRPRLV